VRRDLNGGSQLRFESRWRAYLPAASAVGALTLFPEQAQAQYLDPGAGSIIIQVVMAVVVGLAATLKLYWGRISALVSRRSKRDSGL
jgi:hypothetical protein